MKKIPLDQVYIIWYQDSISGEISSASFSAESPDFWVHLEFFPDQITEVYMLEEGESRPHPKVGWAYARGVLR